jgi:hypothetical protein
MLSGRRKKDYASGSAADALVIGAQAAVDVAATAHQQLYLLMYEGPRATRERRSQFVTRDELNRIETALTRARENHQRALVAANKERSRIDTACWHRRHDADIARLPTSSRPTRRLGGDVDCRASGSRGRPASSCASLRPLEREVIRASAARESLDTSGLLLGVRTYHLRRRIALFALRQVRKYAVRPESSSAESRARRPVQMIERPQRQ